MGGQFRQSERETIRPNPSQSDEATVAGAFKRLCRVRDVLYPSRFFHLFHVVHSLSHLPFAPTTQQRPRLRPPLEGGRADNQQIRQADEDTIRSNPSRSDEAMVAGAFKPRFPEKARSRRVAT